MLFYPIQLGHELNRIMGSDVVSYMNNTWKILCPKIMAICKDEASYKQCISELISDLPSYIPDGTRILCTAFYS